MTLKRRRKRKRREIILLMIAIRKVRKTRKNLGKKPRIQIKKHRTKNIRNEMTLLIARQRKRNLKRRKRTKTGKKNPKSPNGIEVLKAKVLKKKTKLTKKKRIKNNQLLAVARTKAKSGPIAASQEAVLAVVVRSGPRAAMIKNLIGPAAVKTRMRKNLRSGARIVRISQRVAGIRVKSS